jgi:HlyD family secretion protein
VSNDRYLRGLAGTLWTALPVLVCAGLALLLPLVAGCDRHAEASATKEEPQASSISTIFPVRQDLTREIDQPGDLRPYEQTPIYTKIAGFAKEPRYDIGDRVKKGELLLELYVPEVVQDLHVKEAKVQQAKADQKQAEEASKAAKAAVEAAKADIEAKQAAIRSAEAQVLRWQAEDVRGRRLVVTGVYDQQTADEVVNQLRASEAFRDQAKANLSSTRAQYDQASAQYNKSLADIEVAVAEVAVAEAARDQWSDWLSYAKITAPFDGIITLRNVHSGHFLQPSNSGSTSKAAEPLFVMMRTDIMRCTVEVPELDAVLVREHDKVIVSLQAMPGVLIPGEVTRFSYSLDERARTLRVECHLKNADGVLRPGMYANVKILAKLRNAWTLPADTIMSDILADGDRFYCYMVENGKALKTFLQVGSRCDEGVQILSKQRPGGKWESITGKEAVVATNPKALLDGQDVVVQAPETQTVAR